MSAVPDPLTRIIDDISADRMMGDIRAIAKHVRLSGTAEEALAFDYIETELNDLGLATHRYACDALVSLPGPASVRVLSPNERDIACITHSMAASTPDGGVTGEVSHLGAGKSADFAGSDLAGRIVLVDGLVSPGVAARAARAGCAAVVFSGDGQLHQGIISDLYGSPTSKTMDRLPDCVAASISGFDGAAIKAELADRPVTLRVSATVDTGWRQLPLVTADLPGAGDDDTYAFFGVHVDSWDVGATDNAAGNAILVELARVFTAHRAELARGVRFLFWSGHSHGRYAGSCWYVDNFWQDLYDRAVIAMSIDSPGTKGAVSLGGAKVMDEAVAVATEVAELAVGHEVPSPQRPPGGEQPLWRVGVPSMNPVRWRHRAGSEASLSFSPTSPWWHHTVEDTIDKVDPDVLLSDARIYAAGLARFVTDEVLPLDYAALARAIAEHVRALPAATDLADLAASADDLAAAVDAMADARPADINDRIRRIGRTLVPVAYTVGGPFEPDPATRQGFLPGLAAATRAADLDPSQPLHHALRTELVREGNRLRHALVTATQIATSR
ncbi:MAG TPA: M28 family peptidase [Jatrophihabitantaceae bacterium]|jgi:hypothetical protein